MRAKTEATIEDLYRVPENAKAELVNGEIVLMSPTGGLPGYAADRILISLDEHARRTGSGYAFGDNKGFIVNLPHRKSFSPDAAFYTSTLTMRFLEGAPIFAIEVRSEGDAPARRAARSCPAAEQEIAAKRADYFTAGTLVVWDVDLLSDEVVRVYRVSNLAQYTVYRRSDIAEAEPAVPGWAMPVDDLFPRRTQ